MPWRCGLQRAIPETPLAAKVLAAGIAAYAFSPIDLIPDFIPVLGLLDDLLLVPLGIWIVLRMIPGGLMREFRAKAAAKAERPVSRVAALAVVAVWVTLTFVTWRIFAS